MHDLLAMGELNVDIILKGIEQAPSFGHEIIADDYAECLGSSTAICACVAAHLGMRTAFCGKLGDDARGALVRTALMRYSVDMTQVHRDPCLRTGITVSMSNRTDRALVTCFCDTIDCLTASDVDLEAFPAKHLHVGSYFLQTKLHASLPKLFQQAHSLGMTTSLDAGWDDSGLWMSTLSEVLPHTDFFFPNEKEAEQITGASDMEQAARQIAAYGCTAVIKLGGKGALACMARDARCIKHKAYVTHVLDTTGAGDSFNAGFLTAFIEKKSLVDCLSYGNAAGAVSVTRIGGTTQCPSREEVEQTIINGYVKVR
ncbi:MAG: carbohydrate kinase family protein [Clostridia bacterium]